MLVFEKGSLSSISEFRGSQLPQRNVSLGDQRAFRSYHGTNRLFFTRMLYQLMSTVIDRALEGGL